MDDHALDRSRKGGLLMRCKIAVGTPGQQAAGQDPFCPPPPAAM